MERILIILAGLAAVLLAGCGAAGNPAGSYRQISQEEAAAMMESERDYILLDVRTEEEYAQGHIPGAICIPNETIGTEDVEALPDKDQLIFVYCRSGRRSREAALILAELGYTEVYDIGSLIGWPYGTE